MKLGEIIKAYREEHNQSQRAFASACGLSNGYISMLENETNGYNDSPMVPKLTALKKIADAMGMTLNNLILEMDDIPVSLSIDEDAPIQQDERTDEVIRLYSGLDPAHQDMLLHVLRGLLADQAAHRDDQGRAD